MSQFPKVERWDAFIFVDLHKKFQKMNALVDTQQFRMNPRIISNPEDIFKFDNGMLKLQHENRKESVLIESYSGKEKTGFLLILPLFSRSNPEKKQAVFFSNISCSNRIEAELLIREGLMCSWEMGYHVAFAPDTNSFYGGSEFRKAATNFFYPVTTGIPFVYSELTWDGIKQISHDLIFPFIVNE